MTRPYPVAFKRTMVERLIGKDAISANQLAKETGVRQQVLSRWLREARNLPEVDSRKPSGRTWTVAQKARLLADASELTGDELTCPTTIRTPRRSSEP